VTKQKQITSWILPRNTNPISEYFWSSIGIQLRKPRDSLLGS